MITKKSFINASFTIDYEHNIDGFNMPYAHYHNDYEIYILTKGDRIVTIDGTEYKAVAPNASMFSANSVHSSRGDTPYSGISLHFSEQYLKHFFTSKARTHMLRCFQVPVIQLSLSSCEYITKLADSYISNTNINTDKDTNTNNNYVLLNVILTLLSNEMEKAATKVTALANNDITTPSPASSKSTKARTIFSYVDENFISINSIEELALHFEVSERYIFKLFKKEYNVTPKQYINSKRIKAVCHILRYTKTTVKHAAIHCGYNSYEYFYKVFVKEMNCTPTEYRNKFVT